MGEEGFAEHGDNVDSKKKGKGVPKSPKVPQVAVAVAGGSGATPRKLQKTDVGELSEEEMDALDQETQHALDGIDAVQNELDGLNEKATDEILAIERKYNQLRKPILEKRQEAIAKLPDFWVTAMRNHPTLSILMNEEEDECLQFLSKFFIEDAEDMKSGYKLEFHFLPNPYFENSVLVKEYTEVPELENSDNGYACKSTPIVWKEGMDLIKRMGGVNIGLGKRKREQETFFSWFTKDSQKPVYDEIAETLKEDFWTNPMGFYMSPGGDIQDEDDMDEEGEEMDDSDEDLDDNGEISLAIEDEDEEDG